MKLSIAIAALAISSLSWSCGHRVTAPQGKPYALHLDLQLSSPSGDPTHPIDVTAIATNQGTRTVYHSESCWVGESGFQLLDPTGEPVYWYNPRVMPLCYGVCCLPLEPGRTTSRVLRFDGHLFTADGQPYAAPEGEYAVVASFQASTEQMGGASIDVTHRASLRWAG